MIFIFFTWVLKTIHFAIDLMFQFTFWILLMITEYIYFESFVLKKKDFDFNKQKYLRNCFSESDVSYLLNILTENITEESDDFLYQYEISDDEIKFVNSIQELMLRQLKLCFSEKEKKALFFVKSIMDTVSQLQTTFLTQEKFFDAEFCNGYVFCQISQKFLSEKLKWIFLHQKQLTSLSKNMCPLVDNVVCEFFTEFIQVKNHAELLQLELWDKTLETKKLSLIMKNMKWTKFINKYAKKFITLMQKLIVPRNLLLKSTKCYIKQQEYPDTILGQDIKATLTRVLAPIQILRELMNYDFLEISGKMDLLTPKKRLFWLINFYRFSSEEDYKVVNVVSNYLHD